MILDLLFDNLIQRAFCSGCLEGVSGVLSSGLFFRAPDPLRKTQDFFLFVYLSFLLFQFVPVEGATYLH